MSHKRWYCLSSVGSDYLRSLREKYTGRGVIWCGDLNVAHDVLDIYNSKGNQKSAGHTLEERESFGSFLKNGEWIDVWRQKNPGERRYTFWSARINTTRNENMGWRLDYFIVTKELAPMAKCLIRDKFKVMKKDHSLLYSRARIIVRLFWRFLGIFFIQFDST